MSAGGARSTGEARPRSVAAVVRSVRTGLRLTRALEAVLFFVAGLLLARSAALVSHVQASMEASTWSVACLCGALCAAAWWLEHPHGLSATASALDRRLRHQEALTTAFELEQRIRPALTRMEELVRQRVLERLRTRAALRALFPSLVLPVAAPTVALLALAWATDWATHWADAPAPDAVDFGALAAGLERSLSLSTLELPTRAQEPSESEVGRLSAARRQALDAMLQARRILPYSSAEWARAPAEARRQLEELDRRMADLAALVSPASELNRELFEARNWLDALRTGLAQPPDAAPGAAAAGSGAGSLTSAPSDGTISRPPPAPGPMENDPTLPSAHEPAPTTSALGLQAGNWWPAEYDAVVARWLELSEAQHPGR